MTRQNEKVLRCCVQIESDGVELRWCRRAFLRSTDRQRRPEILNDMQYRCSNPDLIKACASVIVVSFVSDATGPAIADVAKRPHRSTVGSRFN